MQSRLRLLPPDEYRSIAATDPIGPTQIRERIAALDVLRGFALLGILVLNIDSFSGPMPLHDIPAGGAKHAFLGWHAQLDFAILLVKWMVFEGKMRALFAMLFGAGIVLLTQRFEQRGQADRAADIFCRRNMWLLLFGLLHGCLIWQGDILFVYAFIALLGMYPCRKLAPKRLILVGLAIGVIGGGFGIANEIHAVATLSEAALVAQGEAARAAHRPISEPQRAAIDRAERQKTAIPKQIEQRIAANQAPYLATVGQHASDFVDDLVVQFASGGALEFVGEMLLGMGLFKLGFFAGGWSARAYALTALTGYAISWPITAVGLFVAHAHGFSTASVTQWVFLPYTLETFPGALANAAMLLLLWNSRRAGPLMAGLSSVGRTAFSNYILTSLLCRLIFSWGPWKLYGHIDYYQTLFVLVGVWAFNIIASTLWLRSFSYGPLEWVWRSLTYWRLQPLRRSGGDAAHRASTIPARSAG